MSDQIHRKGQWSVISVGKRFGKLVVISPTDQKIVSKNGVEIDGRLAIFRCDCGKEVIKPYRNAEYGRILSCGCSRHQSMLRNRSPNWCGYEEISGDFWNSVKRCAKTRGIIVEIDIEYAWEKYIEQDRKCALSGEPLFFPKTHSDQDKRSSNISLDRIDSSKGYIKGNVQWVTKKINRMKMNLSDDVFITICKKVSLHNSDV